MESREAAEEIVERLHGRMVRGWNDSGCRISVRFADTSEQRELRVSHSPRKLCTLPHEVNYPEKRTPEPRWRPLPGSPHSRPCLSSEHVRISRSLPLPSRIPIRVFSESECQPSPLDAPLLAISAADNRFPAPRTARAAKNHQRVASCIRQYPFSTSLPL